MGAPGEVEPVPNSIILFDGVCNLCSASVQFIIKRDAKSRFKFASLQSEIGQRLQDQFGIDKSKVHSIVLITDKKHLQQSDAALEIAKRLGGGWTLLYFFKIFPRFIRDSIYNWISRNRYRFFGRKNSCWIPTPELKSRFID